jgi:hypothetical protein
VWECSLDSTGSWQDVAARFWEQGVESSGSINNGKLLHKLKDCYILKRFLRGINYSKNYNYCVRRQIYRTSNLIERWEAVWTRRQQYKFRQGKMRKAAKPRNTAVSLLQYTVLPPIKFQELPDIIIIHKQFCDTLRYKWRSANWWYQNIIWNDNMMNSRTEYVG